MSSQALFKDRIKVLQANRLCFGCLKSGHFKANCREWLKCEVRERSHPTILHIATTNTSVQSISSPAYAFLDTGSNVTFISEKLKDRLGISGKKAKLRIDTMGFPHTMTTYTLKGLMMSGLDNKHVVEMGQVYTKDDIPARSSHIPCQSDNCQVSTTI